MSSQRLSRRIRQWNSFLFKPLTVLSVFSLAQAETKNFKGVRLESFEHHTRLTLHLDSDAKSTLAVTSSGFKWFFPKRSLMDLGFYGMRSEAWKKAISEFKDARLSDLKLAESLDGIEIQGTWEYVKGPKAPAYPAMETFQFRQSDKASLALDFWPKKGPTVAEIQLQQERDKQLQAIRLAEEKARKRIEKRVASEKRVREATDPGKICRMGLDEKNEIFLRLHAVHPTVELGQWFSAQVPDQDYPYLEPKGPDADATHMREALKLKRSGNYALSVRAVDFFLEQTPDSPLRNPMIFLKANALLKLRKDDVALSLLEQLVRDEPNSAEALHSAMFLGQRAYEQEQWLSALDRFLWMTNHHTSHRLGWVFHLGAAEALYRLKQSDRAIAEYTHVADNSTSPKWRAEAMVRIGDVYFEKNEWDQAIAAYYRASSKYPKDSVKISSLSLNRGEALYRLGEFERSKNEYARYLKDFPNQSVGWRAPIRIAEIHARTKGNTRETADYRNWLKRTINEYPFTSGSIYARLRLFPCGDQGGLTIDSAGRFFEEEAPALFEDALIEPVGINETILLHRIRGFLVLGAHRRELPEILKKLESQLLRQDVQSQMTEFSLMALRGAIEEEIHENPEVALKTFERFWPRVERQLKRHSDPLRGLSEEYEFLVGLAKAASKIGLGELAQSYIKLFEQITSDSDRSLASVTAAGVGIDQLDLEAATQISELAYLRAKGIWDRESAQAKLGEETEKLISAELAKIADESPHSLARELLATRVAQKAGRLDEALHRAQKAQILSSRRGSSPGLDFLVADLLEKNGRTDAAIEALKKVSLVAGREPATVSGAIGSFEPSEPTAADVMFLESRLYEQKSRWKDAANLLKKIRETGAKDNQTLYRLGRSLIKQDDPKARDEGIGILKQVMQSETQDFWKQMAQEALKTMALQGGGA